MLVRPLLLLANNVLLFLKSLPASNQKLASRAQTETRPPSLWGLFCLICASHPSMERLRPRVRILRKSLILYFLQQTTVSHQTHLFPRPILGHSARAVNSEGKVFEYNSHTSPIVFIGDIQNADLALFFVVFVLSEEKCLRMNTYTVT